MGNIFNYDGPLFSGLSRLADLVWLNILFILCCLPIFTIGASTSALYYVTMKMVKNEECYITKSFFRSFKQNFKQGVGIWLLTLLVGVILVVDYKIMAGDVMDMSMMPDGFRKFMQVFLFAITIVFAMVVRYVFPLLAKFDNTVRNTIRNSMIISIRHLPYTLLLLLIPVVPAVLTYFFPVITIGYFLIFFSLVSYISARIFVKIFAYYLPPQEAEDPFEEALKSGDQQE